MKRFLWALLLLAGAAQADVTVRPWTKPCKTNVIAITSLPYTTPTAGTADSCQCYSVSTNLNSNSDGINVTQPNVKILGPADTTNTVRVTFDRDSTGNAYGLNIAANLQYVEVWNIDFIQNKTNNTVLYGSYGGSDCTGIQIGSNTKWISIIACRAWVCGHSSISISDASGGGRVGHYFSYTNATSGVNSFNSRHDRDATAFDLSGPELMIDVTSDTMFSFWVRHCRIDSACHAGLTTAGKAWIDSNYVFIDTHNENPGVSWANAHAIADAVIQLTTSQWTSDTLPVWVEDVRNTSANGPGGGRAFIGNFPNSRYVGNTIRTGTNHYGGRGLYFNYATGSPLYGWIWVYGNDIRVTQGYTTEAEDGRGCRIRWECYGLWLDSNYIEITMDKDAGTNYAEEQGHGIWASLCTEGTDAYAIGRYLRMTRNTIVMSYSGADGSGSGNYSSAIFIDNPQSSTYGFANELYLAGNRLVSNTHCLSMSYEGGGVDTVPSYGDTLEWTTPTKEDTWGHKGAITLGAAGESMENLQLINPVLIGMTDSTAAVTGSGSVTSTMTFRRVHELTVLDGWGEPINGAEVTYWPAPALADTADEGDALSASVTNAQGVTEDTLIWLHVTTPPSMSNTLLSYNPWRVRVVDGSDILWARRTVTGTAGNAGFNFDDTILFGIPVAMTVLGSNGLPVERATVKIKSTDGDSVVLLTNGWGQVADTLPGTSFTVWIYKHSYNLGAAGYITDTTTFSTSDLIRQDTLHSTLGSDPERISILFSHYSNGTIALQGNGSQSYYYPNITETLDTLTVVSANGDTATGKIRFQSYRMNNDNGTPKAAPTLTGEYGNEFNYTGATYDWVLDNDWDRTIIWNRQDGGPSGDEHDIAGILEYNFKVANKENQAWWQPFRTHVDDWDTTEVDGFDIWCMKNPQRAFGNMTDARRDSIKILYQVLHDSCANHPERDYVLVFGFPRDEDNPDASQTEAGLTTELVRYLNDTMNWTAPNVWFYDSWSPFLTYKVGHYMDPAYDSLYSFPDSLTDGSDHIYSGPGGTLFQRGFVPFIDSVMEDLLDRRRGTLAVQDTGGGEPTPTPPVANFSGTPLSGNLPLEVTFTDLSTNTPTSWDWDWGDLTTHGTTQNPSHTYTEAGSYTVTLTATNADGPDDEVKVNYVTVTAPEPEPQAGKRYTIQPRKSGGGNSSSYLIEVKK